MNERNILMSDESQRIGKYLNELNKSYGKENSLTDILNSFRLMSKDYTDFNNEEIKVDLYTSNNYLSCTKAEQNKFWDKTLCKIETLVTANIYSEIGQVSSWGDIFELLLDDNYAMREKIKRAMVFSVYGNKRPKGDGAYMLWNGLQIIDIDIKDSKLANELKPLIFNTLSRYHWFLGCCISASGKSLHIWTKITPLTIDEEHRRTEFMCNFRHKYSFVYMALLVHAEPLGIPKSKIMDYIDMAMAKPQQGIFISSDKTAMMSTNFIDLRLDVNFEQAFDTGMASIDWINHPDLKETFAKLEWFARDSFNKENDIEIDDLSNIDERDSEKNIRKHYKYDQRWQLANTLNALYGDVKGLQYLVDISVGTSKKELEGVIHTAKLHNKPISKWAVKELNKYHGFSIKLNNDNELEHELSTTTPQPIEYVTTKNTNSDNYVELHIKSTQYLSNIESDIVANLGHITLLEAGAGYGKTEMIKSLKSKTLLILPFTSTIKAKVEASETTSDWLYFYGNNRPTIDDLLTNRSMSMTIDKFSRLNVMELDIANFKYIVLDESHLLFTSSYREVMSPTIQRLANCKAHVIMMTGTPTGELLFFPSIKHIKVRKEDFRIKRFDLYITENNVGKFKRISEEIGQDIINGNKILFPTNSGYVFFMQLKAFVEDYLTKHGYDKDLKIFYYKKSNYGDKSMDDINMKKTIGENDIICCTTYLSVGVDICDRYTFSVYFDETWIPQDIEQFANRLRNNDLYIKMFLPQYENDEDEENRIPIDYSKVTELDLSFNEEERLMARDFIKLCNDMIDRNQDESKYSPIISSIISSNPYIKYDENERQYYIDETTYKLHVFENKYSKYAKQISVLTKGMKEYGYDVVNHINEFEDYTSTEKQESKEVLKNIKIMCYEENTNKVFEFLEHITDANIDIYKEMVAGNYSIYRSDEYEGMRETNDLYTADIETVEKNLNKIIRLYRFYDIETIKEIYKSCVENKKLNYSKLNRIIKLVSIIYNKKKNRLDLPIQKIIYEFKKWVRFHSTTNKEEIDEFLRNTSALYANTIPHVLTNDLEFFKQIHETIKELWGVIIERGKSKKGKVDLQVSTLKWEEKQDGKSIFIDDQTKEFLWSELEDKMNTEEQSTEIATDENEEVDYEFVLTEKDKYEDVKETLKDVIHSDYNYFGYSKDDGSNERFMRKQENTNSFKDTIFDQQNVSATTTPQPTTQLELFEEKKPV